MKVSIVTITISVDGSVEVTTKPFFKFEDAAKYLHSEYLDFKAENEDLDYCYDEVSNLTEDSSDYFFLQSDDLEYWVCGSINTTDVK